MKIRNNISLITVLTVISLTQCFGDIGGYIAPSAGGSGQDAGKIIKANIAKSEQNLAKCKTYLNEIKEIHQKSQYILNNMDAINYKSKLEYIKKDIISIEAELKSEKNPAQRAELQKIIKIIRKVEVEIRRRGI